jgi:hypothetical protein
LQHITATCHDGGGFFAYELENNRMLKTIDKRIDEWGSLLDSAVDQNAILLVPQDITLGTCNISLEFISTHLIVMKPEAEQCTAAALGDSNTNTTTIDADADIAGGSNGARPLSPRQSPSLPILEQRLVSAREFESLNGITGRFAHNLDSLMAIHNPFLIDADDTANAVAVGDTSVASATASPSSVTSAAASPSNNASPSTSRAEQDTDATATATTATTAASTAPVAKAQHNTIHILREGQVVLGNREPICILFIGDALYVSDLDRKAADEDQQLLPTEQEPETISVCPSRQ